MTGWPADIFLEQEVPYAPVIKCYLGPWTLTQLHTLMCCETEYRGLQFCSLS